MNYCIQTNNLSYRYSANELILDNINLHVPQGSIYGFLGPNGAGKTTTLKLLLGLLKNQQGEILISGKDFHRNRIEILRTTGSLIETPSLYGQLSASENLEVFRKIYGTRKERISDVLALVGLSHTGKKKAGAFSLGMKQRLSIAIALLHKPALLVLDEPTNGLDPNGILEMRSLLRNLNADHGITIVVSSHLLAEIEKLVTHVGIINRGSMVFEGTLGELMQKQESASFLQLETSDPQRTLDICEKQNIPASLEHNKVVTPLIAPAQIALLNRNLVHAGIDVYAISPVKNDLESIFMHMTNSQKP
ncbi:MAG TPA: ATP-binding cassette domain-containing protein [Bacteroidia bacterium]|nr:ATP-binding cassette domain-containing protein [Bacteroidia bacterium]